MCKDYWNILSWQISLCKTIATSFHLTVERHRDSEEEQSERVSASEQQIEDAVNGLLLDDFENGGIIKLKAF